jgi:hypothetical protein
VVNNDHDEYFVECLEEGLLLFLVRARQTCVNDHEGYGKVRNEYLEVAVSLK